MSISCLMFFGSLIFYLLSLTKTTQGFQCHFELDSARWIVDANFNISYCGHASLLI